MVCVAQSLASVAAREHYRSVADMALCHPYEAVVSAFPDAGVNSGQGIFPDNLSCLARQLLAAIGATEVFEGFIRRASRFSSGPLRFPGIHFPAPGRPRFLLAGAVDIIGIANAVLHHRLVGLELIGLPRSHSLPCSTWAAAYAALAHSFDLAWPYWYRPCHRVPVDPSLDISPRVPVYERYPLSMEDVYGTDEFNSGAAESDDGPPSSPADASPAGAVCWDTLLVRVFRQHVSVRHAMEMARQLALASLAWDVPSACLVPAPVALAAAGEVLGEDYPSAPAPPDGCSSSCPCNPAVPRPLDQAVRADLQAALSEEQKQEHRPWTNPRHLQSPGGVDVFALANVIYAHDASMLEDRVRHLVTRGQRHWLPSNPWVHEP